MRWILCFTLLISALAATAQTTITGTVSDSELGKPMAGISVTVRPKGSASMLKFALTDEKGAYRLVFSSAVDSIILTASGMSIKKWSAAYPNKNSTISIKAAYEAIVLKEMKVKPPKIRRLDDTLNYSVGQFTGKNDRTIADALKRMPGIKVAENGAISYNGKPINRLYIDNQDLLEGRYGLASNNVEAKDVETVQVLENHQPIKAVRNLEFTDEAAINLKLKESAKDVWVANAQLGIGYGPLLWNNEAFGMKFGKNKQFMGTYKGNNTGTSSSADLQSFYNTDNYLDFPIALAIQSPQDPQVSRKRYLMNNDHAFTFNHLRILQNDYRITATASYLNERTRKSSYFRSENFLPSGTTLVIQEQVNSLQKLHHLEGTIKLGANKERLFLENLLKYSGDLQLSELGTVTNIQPIDQQRSAPYFRISNQLSFIKNYKKTTFRVNSYNGFGRLNDALEIQPMLYTGLFGDQGTFSGMRQSLTQHVFASINSVSFGISHRKFQQHYTAGANANLTSLNSALAARTAAGQLGSTPDSLSNALNWNRYDLYIRPEYSYTVKKNNINLKVPISYTDQQARQQHSGKGKGLERIFFSPSISAVYHLDLLWQLNARAAYGQDIDGLENGFEGYIMQSYRNLVRNQGELPERNSLSYSTGMSYRHPIKAVFSSLNISYFKNQMNLLYGNEFQGILSVKRTLAIPNSSSGASIALAIEKGLDGTVNKISLNAGYRGAENTQLNQAVITTFNSRTYSAGAGLDAKLSTWGDFRYTAAYARSGNAIKNDGRSFEPISTASQQATLNLFPLPALSVKFNYHYSFNSAVQSSSRTMNFADTEIRYKLKKLEFNLELSNIFNTRRYLNAAYTGIGSYSASYELRPVQVLAKVRMSLR